MTWPLLCPASPALCCACNGFVLRGKGVGHGFVVFLGISFFSLFWQRLKLLVISEYQAFGSEGFSEPLQGL